MKVLGTFQGLRHDHLSIRHLKSYHLPVLPIRSSAIKITLNTQNKQTGFINSTPITLKENCYFLQLRSQQKKTTKQKNLEQ